MRRPEMIFRKATGSGQSLSQAELWAERQWQELQHSFKQVGVRLLVRWGYTIIILVTLIFGAATVALFNCMLRLYQNFYGSFTVTGQDRGFWAFIAGFLCHLFYFFSKKVLRYLQRVEFWEQRREQMFPYRVLEVDMEYKRYFSSSKSGKYSKGE